MFSVGMEKPSYKFFFSPHVYMKNMFVEESDLFGLLHLLT